MCALEGMGGGMLVFTPNIAGGRRLKCSLCVYKKNNIKKILYRYNKHQSTTDLFLQSLKSVLLQLHALSPTFPLITHGRRCRQKRETEEAERKEPEKEGCTKKADLSCERKKKKRTSARSCWCILSLEQQLATIHCRSL